MRDIIGHRVKQAGEVSTTTPVLIDGKETQGITITVAPEAGVTVLVETSTSANAAQVPEDAIWIPWADNVVAGTTSDINDGFCTGIRITKKSGAGSFRYEVIG